MPTWYPLDCKSLLDRLVCLKDLISWACLHMQLRSITLVILFYPGGESQSPYARSTSVRLTSYCSMDSSRRVMQPVMTQHLEIWCCHHLLWRNHVCWRQRLACYFGAADPAWRCQHVARGMGHQGLTNPASSAQAILRKAPAHVSDSRL